MGRGEHVIVVEDDADVRAVAVSFLGNLGYNVKEAGRAEAALEQIRQGTAIELLIADTILPGGMDGRGLAKAAGDLIPDLKILYISGYTEDAIVQHGRLDPGVQLLVKPFAQNEFATKIRAIFESLDILESPPGHDAP